MVTSKGIIYIPFEIQFTRSSNYMGTDGILSAHLLIFHMDCKELNGSESVKGNTLGND